MSTAWSARLSSGWTASIFASDRRWGSVALGADVLSMELGVQSGERSPSLFPLIPCHALEYNIA
jgi:hypothetical protein